MLETAAAMIAECGHASDTNQAIMDIGAGCCSKSPQCSDCPLEKLCYAASHALTQSIPYKKKSIQKYDEFRAALKLTTPDGRLLIAQRPQNVLLGGLWEYPMICISRGKGKTHLDAAQLRMRLPRTALWLDFLSSLSPQNAVLPLSEFQFSAKTISHTFTHIEMRVSLDVVQCSQIPVLPDSSPDYTAFALAIPNEIGPKFAVSTLMKKLTL